MKNYLFLCTLFFFYTQNIFSQNVGINTNQTIYPLTVKVPSSNNYGIGQIINSSQIGFVTNPTDGATLSATGRLSFAANGGNPNFGIFSTGFVDIGGNTPTSALDVNGRIRIQNQATGNQTAGIWFDGIMLPTRTFLGTINDDHVGIYGNNGASWAFAMNVENGNTGIGTAEPTAQLDVNGTFKYKDITVKKGSVLTSLDANGNATYQEPIAFRAQGSVNGLATNVVSRLIFSATPDYNIGGYYDPLISEFEAPIDGIYHFSAQIAINLNTDYAKLHLNVLNQVNELVAVRPAIVKSMGSTTLGSAETPITLSISADIPLLQGHRVYVSPQAGGGFNHISGDPQRTWFSGHFVSRL